MYLGVSANSLSLCTWVCQPIRCPYVPGLSTNSLSLCTWSVNQFAVLTYLVCQPNRCPYVPGLSTNSLSLCTSVCQPVHMPHNSVTEVSIENCVLLDHYPVSSDNSLPTFRDCPCPRDVGKELSIFAA